MIDKVGVSGTGTPLATSPPTAKEDPAKVAHAARQFEALLLGQMLKSLREAESSGWLGGGTDNASDCAMAIAEEQFAQVLSSNGGLGLANMVISGLENRR